MHKWENKSAKSIPAIRLAKRKITPIQRYLIILHQDELKDWMDALLKLSEFVKFLVKLAIVGLA